MLGVFYVHFADWNHLSKKRHRSLTLFLLAIFLFVMTVLMYVASEL